MSSISLEPILERFAELLADRFAHRSHTSEDSIRYTFFLALVEAGVSPRDITLEEDFPDHPDCHIDTIVYEREGRRSLLLEFKYHRARDVAKDVKQPTTQLAGDLFRDLFRLAYVQAYWKCPAYFVYVTDAGMAGYFRRREGILGQFLDLPLGDSLHFGRDTLGGRAATFTKSLGQFYGYPGTLSRLYSKSLPHDHILRVYTVEHLPSTVYEYR